MSLGKVMTYNEMAAAFANEWVFVVDPEVDENNKVSRGRVVAHDPSKEKVYQAELEAKPKRSAIICFKSLKPGTGYAF